MSSSDADAKAAAAAARRAKILARGADRLALLKGEVPTLPKEAAEPEAPQGKATADDILLKALDETIPSVKQHDDGASGDANGAAPKPTAGANGAAPTAAKKEDAKPSAPAPKATEAALSAAKAAASKDAAAAVKPRPAEAVPSKPLAAPPPAQSTSLVAAAALQRRLQHVAHLRATLLALWPALLGAALSYLWWSCGQDVLPFVAAAKRAVIGASSAQVRSLAAQKLGIQASGGAGGSAGGADDEFLSSGTAPDADAVDASISSGSGSVEGFTETVPEVHTSPVLLEGVTRYPPPWAASAGVCGSDSWPLPLVLVLLLLARLLTGWAMDAVAQLVSGRYGKKAGGSDKQAGGGDGAPPTDLLVQLMGGAGGAMPNGLAAALGGGAGGGGGMLSTALKYGPRLLSAGRTMQAVAGDLATFVVVFVLTSAALS